MSFPPPACAGSAKKLLLEMPTLSQPEGSTEAAAMVFEKRPADAVDHISNLVIRRFTGMDFCGGDREGRDELDDSRFDVWVSKIL